jgi:CheY-like chemotaxis protein/two-component sensor histidine kinase
VEGSIADDIMESLIDAVDGAERVSKLVADFRQAAPSETVSSTEAVDLREVLETAQNVANATVRTRANVSISIDVPGRVVATGARLAQVFINLLVNSAQAIPEGKRGQIRVVAENPGPDFVRVEVRDNGSGIHPDDMDAVFAPFFTTKPPGEGTGLGLSICRNIIEQFGGRLGLESEFGKGTTVWVELQVADEPAHENHMARSHVSEAIDSSARVLIVDDDPHILRMVERVLANTCHVTTADNPKRGLELALSTPFDLVISDVIMPELTGPHLLAEILRERPRYESRLVLMTGGRRVVGNTSNLPTLQKPFGVRDLKKVVRDVLDNRDSDGSAA